MNHVLNMYTLQTYIHSATQLVTVRAMVNHVYMEHYRQKEREEKD